MKPMKSFALLPITLACSVLALSAADFEIRVPGEFGKILDPRARLQLLGSGMGFLEGPVWLQSGGGSLIFSDIPANQLKQWSPKRGLKTFREPSQNANGNTTDLLGRIVSAEHGGRRISVEGRDGKVQTVVDRYDGKLFNSPNDVVVKRDGTYWFTDPDYGLGGRPKEQTGDYVYRYDPATKNVVPVAKDFVEPNGLCFSPDESKLYVADSGTPRHIRVFNVKSDGSLDGGKVFCKINPGGPDGIRCDEDGRIWSSAGDGVHIFAPDGTLIGKILVPETPANLCFGGPKFKTLFITARTSLYAIDTLVKGAKRPLRGGR
jgi:gluconolactonase